MGSDGRAWRVIFAPRPSARLRLLCFPHAGGSPAVYRPWAAALGEAVEVAAVQLPGRAGRFREASHRSMATLADAAAEGLADLSGPDTALFGHSLGGLLAYEVALRWRAMGLADPAHLIVSGVHAPHIPPERTGTYAADDETFIASLARWNGTPREVLAHRELLELLLPSLRADFEAYETYAPSERGVLAAPILALGGDRDPCANAAGVAAWREYTSASFAHASFPGDHFFLHDRACTAIERIRTALGA